GVASDRVPRGGCPDGDARGGVEGDGVGLARRRAADGGVGAGEVDAHGGVVEEVAQRRGAGGTGADEVALDDLTAARGVDPDAGLRGPGNDVAGDVVVVRGPGHVDAVGEVAECRVARPVRTEVVALDDVVVAAAASDADGRPVVLGDHVAGDHRGNAVARPDAGSVADEGHAGDVGADVVSLDDVAVRRRPADA